MNEHSSSEQRPMIEDWCGSNLDGFAGFVVRRVYNGITVEPYAAGLIGQHETLVFQDRTHFIDWFQEWYAKRGVKA